jgi:hypothetical protein
MFPPSSGSVVGPLPTVTTPHSVRTSGSTVAAASRLTALLPLPGVLSPASSSSGAFLPPPQPPPPGRSYQSVVAAVPIASAPSLAALSSLTASVPSSAFVAPAAAQVPPPPSSAALAFEGFAPSAEGVAPPPPSRTSVAPMVASVTAGSFAGGSDYPASSGRRSSLLIPGSVVAAGLLIAVGIVLSAHLTGSTPSAGQGSAATGGSSAASQSSASAHSLLVRATPTATTGDPSHASAGGLIATANVDDLPRVLAPRRTVVGVAAPRAVRPAAAAQRGGANASEAEAVETEDTAASAPAIAATPHKEMPQDNAASEPPAPVPTPPPTAAPTAVPGAPSPDDPLIKAMRQAVDDQAHGK